MNNRPIQLTPLHSFVLVAGVVLSCVAQAQPCEHTPSINISANTSQEIKNDSVRLTWNSQFERANASDAMVEVNKTLDLAIRQLNKNKEVKNLTSNIQTYPQYTQERDIKTWTSVGTLSFEMNVDALQKKNSVEIEKPWALNGIQYFVSDKELEQGRAQLLEQTMLGFQHKAKLVAAGFGHTGYVLGDISINDQSQSNPGPLYTTRAFNAASDVSMAAKGMELATASGTSNVNVSIQGQICLKP